MSSAKSRTLSMYLKMSFWVRRLRTSCRILSIVLLLLMLRPFGILLRKSALKDSAPDPFQWPSWIICLAPVGGDLFLGFSLRRLVGSNGLSMMPNKALTTRRLTWRRQSIPLALIVSLFMFVVWLWWSGILGATSPSGSSPQRVSWIFLRLIAVALRSPAAGAHSGSKC